MHRILAGQIFSLEKLAPQSGDKFIALISGAKYLAQILA